VFKISKTNKVLDKNIFFISNNLEESVIQTEVVQQIKRGLKHIGMNNM